jgi:hypothetical protein
VSGGVSNETGGVAPSTGGRATGSGGTAPSAGSSGRGGTAASGGASTGLGGTGGRPVPTGGSADTGGAAGTGGGTAGDTVCATADEDAGATLECPDGQIIDAVVFASYGTPTGACGHFAPGTCNAESSAAAVDALCQGRHSCTVSAANGTFGDPCPSTVKSLAIEVSCVVGQEQVDESKPYKGVANSPKDELAALGATWCYNWGTRPSATDCDDPLFVPMVWGKDDVAGAIQAIGDAGYTTVLGFNEPNKSDQANMSVEQALALWPDMTKDPDLRVSSPAVSDDGRAWLEDFMDQAQAQGLRVDFIAMHWYGWNAGSCVPSQLEGAVNWASQWGLPVWITEFGCMGSSNPDEQTLIDFFESAIPMLDRHPLVERYAWYPWNTYNHLYENGAMTALGEAYAAAPQYR